MEENGNRLLFFRERAVDDRTGYITKGGADRAVNIEPVRVYRGTTLRWLNKKAAGRVFFYSTKIREDWVHTFCYEPESNWALYDREQSETGWTSENRKFDRDGYIRIALRPAAEHTAEDLPGLTRAESVCGVGRSVYTAERVFYLEHPAEALHEQAQIRPCFREEAERVGARLEAVREPGDLVFFLLTDTHYTVNGNWEDTAKNVKYLAERCRPDFAVHLGDLTDGLLPGAVTKQYSGRILDTLHEAAGPVYCCLGNHDTNYAGNNPERFTKEEAAAWYLKYVENDTSKEYYVIDDAEHRLRLFFLSSFDADRDTENDRYGYSDEECRWLEETLRETPEGCGVLVFSHVPLLPEMHVWSDGIRGSAEAVRILEEFQQERHALLAFFHGHNHCDQIERKLSFPIVSVGCGKLESFPEKKPAGAVCYDRERGTVTQDLWDVVRVSRGRGTIDRIRFGAGNTADVRIEIENQTEKRSMPVENIPSVL